MRIAIAGTGDLAKYLVEELLAASYSVVVLARGKRDWCTRPDISLRVTDYTLSSLSEQLEDCDGIVSAIQDNEMSNVKVHLTLLEACTKSPKCKSFIPSEWIGNIEDFPDQPQFYSANHKPIREALKEQTQVKWTLFCLGWLADYVVPAKFRYIRDIDDFHPVNFKTGIITIPGTGNEPIGMTSARDGVKAVVKLFSEEKWESVTYVRGEDTTWNEVKDLLISKQNNFKVVYVSVEDLNKTIEKSKDEDAVFVAQFGMWSASGSTRVPAAKAAEQKKTYFKDVRFRDVRDLINEIEREWPAGKIL